jgi:ABC-2 type transport system permease protein
MSMRALPFSHDVSAIVALTRRDVLRFLRDRSQILGAIGRPAIWMILFGAGLQRTVAVEGGIDYRQFTYAGAIAMTILFAGTFQGITIVWDREFGMLRAVLVAPISRLAIILGKTCAGGVVTLIQGLVAAAFAPLAGVSFDLSGGACLVAAMAALSLGVTGLGTAVGSRMRTFEGFGVVSNFVILPLYFLSGGVFPPQGLPGWMRVLVLVNPVTYGVDAMRAAIGQPHAFSAAVDAMVLAGFAAGTCGLALLMFRRVAH